MKSKNKIIASLISLFLILAPLVAMNAFAAVDTTPPSTPTNLVSALNVGNQVFLHWNASTDNTGVTGYTIMRNNLVLANTVGTSYVDTMVNPNTTYTYSVLAFDAAGNVSGVSSVVSITTLVSSDLVPPSAPTGLTATSSSPTQINLNWATSTDNIAVTGYMIIRNGMLIANTITPSYADLSVVASTTYTYFVLAFDAAGNVSTKSNEVTITTPLSTTSGDSIMPSVPSNLMATAASSSTINLSWTASTDNIGVTGYNIYRNGILISSSTSNTFSNVGLNPSTLYTYYVRAFDAAGNLSAPSNDTSTTTLAINNNPGNSNHVDDDNDEDINDHEDKGNHFGQTEDHEDKGNHFGQTKDHEDKGNHFGQDQQED